MATMPFVLSFVCLLKIENVQQDEGRDGPQTFKNLELNKALHKTELILRRILKFS